MVLTLAQGSGSNLFVPWFWLWLNSSSSNTVSVALALLFIRLCFIFNEVAIPPILISLGDRLLL
ncbi:hypothetical protein DL95DRAFT_396644, partial [Leptodontidium sp. 2 PMI_412]